HLVMRAAAANISAAGAPSWSSYPSAEATPQLVVATTGNPAETTARAVAASHTFGSSKGVPGLCSDRKWSHRLRRSMVMVTNPRERSRLSRPGTLPWQVRPEDPADRRFPAYGIPCEDGIRPFAD